MGIDAGPAIGGLASVATWIEEEQVPEIIDNFLKRGYPRAHYRAMAEEVEYILKDKLKEGGVEQFKLSSRAKDRQSLREKLIVRHHDKGRNYQDFDEIKKDVVDLAGVRIVLYMPTKEVHKKVKNVIQTLWGKDVEARRHPEEDDKDESKKRRPDANDEDDSKNRKYRPRHLGYRAIHYRVPMKDEDRPHSNYEWQENDQVEIQVVSALTHAWAEVGHDILYKSYVYGQPPIDEERILDALNGLIQSGDLLLEQFQEMLLKRTSEPFKHREQLTGFLRSYFTAERDTREDDDDDLEPATFPRGEGIYILFKFLEMEKKNSPMAVRAPLKELQYPYEHRGKERLITQSFYPVPKLKPDMSVVICLIRHLLIKKPYEPPAEPKTAQEMCAIMMSTLTYIQHSLGGPEEAKEYLQKTTMTQAQMQSVNFVLNSNKRHATLEGGRDEKVVEGALQGAWDWFHAAAQEKDGKSFCGFIFRLAEMGCRKHVDPVTQLNQLTIEPLSRSGTANMAEENGPSVGIPRTSIRRG